MAPTCVRRPALVHPPRCLLQLVVWPAREAVTTSKKSERQAAPSPRCEGVLTTLPAVRTEAAGSTTLLGHAREAMLHPTMPASPAHRSAYPPSTPPRLLRAPSRPSLENEACHIHFLAAASAAVRTTRARNSTVLLQSCAARGLSGLALFGSPSRLWMESRMVRTS